MANAEFFATIGLCEALGGAKNAAITLGTLGAVGGGLLGMTANTKGVVIGALIGGVIGAGAGYIVCRGVEVGVPLRK